MRCTVAIENRCTKTSHETQLIQKQEKNKMFIFFTLILAVFKANIIGFLLLFYILGVTDI